MIAPEDLIEEFSQLVLEEDYAAAEDLLAPWVRAALPAGGLRKFLRVAAAEGKPDDFESMLVTDSDLSELPDPPAEVTDSNFVGAYQIDFVADSDLGDDAEVVFSLLVGVVADDGIGYLGTVD